MTDETTAKCFSLWAKLITLAVINESSTKSLFDLLAADLYDQRKQT